MMGHPIHSISVTHQIVPLYPPNRSLAHCTYVMYAQRHNSHVMLVDVAECGLRLGPEAVVVGLGLD